MINQSYLLGLFGVTAGTTTWNPASTAASTPRAQPTAPWSASAEAPEASDLVRAALGGRKILNEGAAVVDLKGASPDYRKLFALYQGLNTLSALADRAAQRNVSSSEQALLARRFGAGVQEISGWLPDAGFEGVRLVQGVASATLKTTAAVPKGTPTYVTRPIHQGALTDEVAAFQGDVQFAVTVETLTGSKAVAIDLAGMGATPRTLDAVVGFINGRLADAGVQTRFAREAVIAEPRTLKVGDKTVTLPARADQWALAVRSNSVETVSFSASQTSDAVYVVQGAGAEGGHQLLKFQSDGGTAPAAAAGVGETLWVDGRSLQTSLPDGVETVRSSAAAADGSLWILADLEAGPADQPIKGERDVALIKLDAAGQVVMTRTLGAASTASGFALAVDATGRVAVAGSVTGALEPGQSGADATMADSFVTLFDAEGEELWTQRRGARAADEATSVAFGPGGMVYVAGRAQSAMSGATALGGWDSYVQAFSQTQVHSLAPVVGVAAGVSQFGTAGDDRVDAVAVDGSNLYSAGIENGRLMLRRFTLDAAGRPTLAASRDLGLASGEVSGLTVVDGKVVVSGTTSNAALAVDTVAEAHHGGKDAFVAVLDGSLTASAADRLTYVGGAGDDSVADVKALGGKIWITGVADRPLGAEETDPTEAYLARVDLLSGAVDWRRDWQGDDQQATPLTLATVAGGASVLDRLGLPLGEIPQEASAALTAATSLRAGDRFYVSPANGGRAVAVTIEAKDTLETLARKIERASNRRLKVTLTTDKATTGDGPGLKAGLQRLSIVARDGQTGAVLMSGEPGRDALAGLGLTPGYVGASSPEEGIKTYGLGLPNDLDLSDPKAAKDKLELAMIALRSAYRALAPASSQAAASGPVPAYLTAQIANYQAALARLGG